MTALELRFSKLSLWRTIDVLQIDESRVRQLLLSGEVMLF